MKNILLKTYDTIVLYGLIENDEIKTFQVESDINHVYKINTFTDLCDAVDCFNHFKSLSRMKLFEDAKKTLVSDDEPCFVFTESEE